MANKQTYLLSKQKKKVRELCFNPIDFSKFHTLVGLPGPDFDEYVKYFSDKGIKRMLLYENNEEIFLKQEKDLSYLELNPRITLFNEDVIKAPVNEKYFYDLDFMATIKSCKSCVQKFTDNFLFTFAVRGVSLEDTCRMFLSARGEKFKALEVILVVSSPDQINLRILHSDKASYKIFTYRDGMPMACITKL